MKRLFRALSLALLLTTTAAAAPEDDFAAAESWFQKARAGDTGAVEEAVARFASLAAADSPRTPLFLAYLGAAQAMQGRDAWMPWNKMKLTERGLASLDKALRRLTPQHDAVLLRGAPVSVETRLVAATTFIAVPELFHRLDAGKAALRDALASPALKSAPAEMRAALERQAALAAARQPKQGSGS